MKGRCEDCRFWRGWKHVADTNPANKGECRRYPPVHTEHPERRFDPADWTYPITHCAEWCGEWQGKDDDVVKLFNQAQVLAEV